MLGSPGERTYVFRAHDVGELDPLLVAELDSAVCSRVRSR